MVNNIKYVLVDEYQDISEFISKLISKIAAYASITVVGDPAQSIYGFLNGTHVDTFKMFQLRNPSHTIIQLPDNFRSTGYIVEVSNALLAQQNMRSRPAFTGNVPGLKMIYKQSTDKKDQAKFVAMQIDDAIRRSDSKLTHKDFVVLSRTKWFLYEFAKQFESYNIPFVVVQNREYEELEVIASYVRHAMNSSNSFASSHIELLKSTSGTDFFDKIIQGLREAMTNGETYDTMIKYLVDVIALQSYLTHKYPTDHHERWQNVQKLIQKAAVSSDVSMMQLINEYRLMELSDADRNSVSLMTIHSAKSLEWPVVFVVDCNDKVMPHSKSHSIEEECRVLYVAMTRTKCKFK